MKQELSAFRVTGAALGANGTYTQDAQDRLGEVIISKVRGYAYSNQAGTLYVEESNDNTAWTSTSTVSVTANVLIDTGWVILTKRFYRFRFVNGAAALTAFTLYQATGTDPADLLLSGSKEKLVISDITKTMPVAASGTETVTIFPASGKHGVIQHLGLQCDAISGATGNHSMYANYGSSTGLTAKTLAYQNGANGGVVSTKLQLPLIFSENNPLVLTYINLTNLSHPGSRYYYVAYVERPVNNQ